MKPKECIKSDDVAPNAEAGQLGIWLNPTYYVRVDENGYVTGACAEGALGCVLQLVKTGAARPRFALKIPRLLADTVRENANIVLVTEDEVANALEVGAKPGLVPANALMPDPLRLRRFGLITSLSTDAQAQDSHVIFVRFEKGRKPRLCSVNFDATGGLSVHPPLVKEEIAKILSAEVWEQIKASIPNRRPEFKATVFCATNTSLAKAIHSGTLEDTLKSDDDPIGWYAAVPAIIYDWASGTLQEAIGKKCLSTWTFQHHFKLFEQVLTGVDSLHSSGMLHGDIRPANVMSVGALEDPALYRLADYGSFGKDTARIGGEEQSGNSMIGPGLSAQRATPFYAPERRAGIERESADTALILTIDSRGSENDQTGEYFVRLGWRSELLEPDSNVIRAGVLEETHSLRKRLIDKDKELLISSPEALRGGDRLRIRDYVFEIIEAGQIDGDVICRCRRRFATVIHDRLAAYDYDKIAGERVLSLSNYVEFRQWSAATDLYSVGALCLYTLFCTGIQNHGMPKTVDDSARSIDSLFADLIRILESVPHFRIFWVQLEQFRSEFETFFSENKGATPSELAKHTTFGEKPLLDLAFDAANQICQSAPYAKVILLQLDLNLNHFLLFMHFVMSCLHRQTHLGLKPEGSAEEFPHKCTPFAKDRVEKLTDRAANRALKRLETLAFYHTQDSLKVFKCKESDIPEFNPKPDVEIRKEITAVKEQMVKANDKLQQTLQANTSLTKDLSEAVRQRELAQAELDKVCNDTQQWRGEFNGGTPIKLWKPFAKRMLDKLGQIKRAPR